MRLFVLFTLIMAVGCRREAPVEVAPTGDKKPDISKAGEKPAAPKPRIWEPDVKLLDQLDAPFEASGYLIRPPKGYKLSPAKVPPREVFMWFSPSAPSVPEKFKTTLALVLLQLPETGNPKHTVDQLLIDSFDFPRKSADNFKTTPIERGKINDIDFVRGEFSGVYKLTKNSYFMKGTHFVGRDGNLVIQFGVTVDTSSEKDDFRAVAEAAVMTFRKK